MVVKKNFCIFVPDMDKKSGIGCYLVAFITVAIWGTTFVWTKLLIQGGISPAQIFTLRFIIAYVLMLGFSLVWPKRMKHRWFAETWKDELLMVALGATGGSMYFLTENEALRYTTATNTSLIVCSCPLVTMMIYRLFSQEERLRKMQFVGSIVACVGMAVVVLNGRFVLELSPIGDMLAFAACLSWAFYSLLMKPAIQRYPSTFITRKVFFYGILTILPYYLIVPEFPSWEILIQPKVVGNLLFLGCVASMMCFLTWNWCISRLGAVNATNWVYVNPLATIVAAWLVLGETITAYFIFGSVLILFGMYLTEREAWLKGHVNSSSTFER